ncbi:MAG: glycerol-3-phosphate 1-O-acyltransferase PlsY [Desulfovibrio sp.]|jgi:glycerol-3-phosphate acyltransferase PlsY|nr:glycerol-3-phosphate 1-O-acyltransferase PlsY [Desulfovibrio sp.]
MIELCWLVGSYLLGAVPWGLVIAKTCCGIDPRGMGSGNTGATNIARTCGFGWGVLTLACDVLKGALPVWGAHAVVSRSPVFVTAVALACVLGHVFSCFMKFRGGKAVATSIGVFIPLTFWQLLGACLACVATIWASGYVSLGSLTLVTVLAILIAATGAWQWLPLALCVAVIVFVKHKENIQRLRSGTEKPWLKSRQSPPSS